MARAYLLAYAERQRRITELRLERRRLRDHSNPLQLPDEDFIANFRLTKAGFHEILDQIQPMLTIRRRSTAVRNELKVLAALLFYAQGSYQRNVGSSVLLGLSQPTMSNCLSVVTNALNAPSVLEKYIKFPSTQEQREIIMRDFKEKFGFPGVIGCINSTHVAIIRPAEHEESFLNQKNYHSLNVLIICDSNLNILYVDAAFGGATFDSIVWNQSPIKFYLESLDRTKEHGWLLGNSGYVQNSWMMTPFLGAVPGTPEEYFTVLHSRVMNTVERCIGVLKSRWRCLLAHKVLHYDPVTAGKIVNACVVLHNIANACNTPMPELPNSDIDSDRQYQVADNLEEHELISDNTRHRLVQKLWTTRPNQ